MIRSTRTTHAEALDDLLGDRVAVLLRDRQWERLAALARLAQSDAPIDLATTDPAQFKAWRDAVTRYHRGGWSRMTPARVEREMIAALLVEGYFRAIGDFGLESGGRGVHEEGVEYKLNDRLARHLKARLPSVEIACDRPLATIRPDIRIGRGAPYVLAEVKRQFQRGAVEGDVKKLSALGDDVASGRFVVACHGRTYGGVGSGRSREEMDRLAGDWCRDFASTNPNFLFEPRRYTRLVEDIESSLATGNYREFDVILISIERRSH